MERMPLLKKSRCPHNQITGYCLDCERQHADALAEALRCWHTGHPCGTDTRRKDDPCICTPCVAKAAHDKLRGR